MMLKVDGGMVKAGGVINRWWMCSDGFYIIKYFGPFLILNDQEIIKLIWYISDVIIINL